MEKQSELKQVATFMAGIISNMIVFLHKQLAKDSNIETAIIELKKYANSMISEMIANGCDGDVAYQIVRDCSNNVCDAYDFIKAN